jgi:two-component system NtrC family sensor kinase
MRFARIKPRRIYHLHLMKRVLVIEDDSFIRTGLVTALRRNGYQTLDAGDGLTGAELAISQRPNVIVCDVNLPGQNGFAVIERLRACTETAAIPVILMTGEGHKADVRYSMEHGADDYLQKPFTMEQMLATLTARLQRQDGIERAMEARTEAERISNAEKIRLQTVALEVAANGICITDKQGTILWVNQAFTRLTGYAPGEAIGQNPRILSSGRHPHAFFGTMWSTITAGKAWHGELINKRKDGTCYHEEMTITPLCNDAGEVQNFIAIKQDVTERKQNEQALAQKRDLLQALMDNLPDYIYFKDVNCRFTQINFAHARHLGLKKPEEAVGKTDADFFPVGQARQKLVDERFLLATGKPILNLVEKVDVTGGQCWVCSNKVPVFGPDGQINGLVGISRDITESQRVEEKLRQSEEQFRQLAATVSDVFWVTSVDLRQLHYVSPAYEQIWGHTTDSLYAAPSQWSEAIAPAERDGIFAAFAALAAGKSDVSVEYRITRPDGNGRWIHDRGFPVRDKSGKIIRLARIASDITDRKRLETELFQARKMESVGQLAAGIAHEINTPTQYVGDNTRFVRDSFVAVAGILDSYHELLSAAKTASITPGLIARTEQKLAAGDLGYLREQIPQALNETLEGIGRVAKIVRAMKEFSHPGGKEMTASDLNKGIESTVTVARNEWKYVADLKLDLDPALPFVPCFLGEINQAVLNLVVNAAHAIGDAVKKSPGTKGLITVQTVCDGDHVLIRVTDTGTGIPESARSKIFEPFFTTKPVGQGTGQGLAMVYGTVVKRHCGTVVFETEAGRGTTFIIRLPVKSRSGMESTPPQQEMERQGT